ADLVEEERAAAGRLEEALAVAVGAGERAPGVAEQLALHQLRRERAAVEGDEAAVPAAARLVDRARHQLLAGAALAGDQDHRVGGAGAVDDVVDRAHRGRATDERA